MGEHFECISDSSDNDKPGLRTYELDAGIGVKKEQISIMREEVLGQPVDVLTYDQVLTLSKNWLQLSPGEVRTKFIFAQNPEKVLSSQEQPVLQAAMWEADVLIPDGSGVVWAIRRKGHQLPRRVTGIDLLHKLVSQAEQMGIGVYFLGGKEKVVNKAVSELSKTFPNLVISGFHHGYFSEEDTDEILERINASGAKLLFTALGSPKQELFLTRNREQLKPNIAMGIGGSLDVIAGEVNRAPELFQKTKLEWFYRLIIDPKRLGRSMQIPRYILKVFWYDR